MKKSHCFGLTVAPLV